jgi:signal transduction histidine kinase
MTTLMTRQLNVEATFRRDAAHALSTPLGSLLLQCELIEHLLRHDGVDKAAEVAGAMIGDCEAFARSLRDVFGAMADMAEDGEHAAQPRECLARAVSDLDDETVPVAYEGDEHAVALPERALEALFRRLAAEMTALNALDVRLRAVRDGDMLHLSLEAGSSQRPTFFRNPFDNSRALNVWTARTIAAHYGGDILAGDRGATVFYIALPLSRPAP